jgi:phosphatidylserine/phosphatidylglycerophosphate/cardiolipin synthase-like enzyme
VIYGKNELQPEENNWLKAQQFVRSSICQNLHAKCYLNESEALITSMNLYEFSQVNNEEMGILVSRAEDPALYAEVYEDAFRLIRASQEIRVSVERIPPSESKIAKSKNQTAPVSGICIRCKAEIKVDPMKPYCKDCYGSWKQYENPEYEERYCHTCGKPNKSTMLKPTCYDCYRSYKDVLTFALGKA